MTLPPLPASWSALSWSQLCDVWTAKMRYGGNPDVAIAAAFLALCRLSADGQAVTDLATGETVYRLKDKDGQTWTATPRQLAYLAKISLPWFPFPYGDQGDEEEKDEQGKVVKEKREGHTGYVNPDVGNWRDAMALPEETVTIDGHTFALPAVACSNLTWHQYRSLQAIVPQLFQEGIGDDDALQLQAQFMAYITVPEPVTTPNGDQFPPHNSFKYVSERAEAAVPFWRIHLESDPVLYYICFQVWQTATANYYPSVFPLLFGGNSNSDPLHTALTGEVGTINAVMKYQGYTDPQQVYDANLPIILGVLNNMTKEAKEIEKMNQQIKRRKK